eukprot:5113705-Prymnesium_polylepis.1
MARVWDARTTNKGGHTLYHSAGAAPACGVCVLRADGTRHADGAHVGEAQQTRQGHARSSTQTRASSPSTHGS